MLHDTVFMRGTYFSYHVGPAKMIGATAPEEAGHVQTTAILALRSFPMHFNG